DRPLAAPQPRRSVRHAEVTFVRARASQAAGGAAEARGLQDRHRLGPSDPQLRARSIAHQGPAYRVRGRQHAGRARRRSRRFHCRQPEAGSVTMAAISMPVAADPGTLPPTLGDVLESLWTRIGAGLDGRWPSWALPTLVTVTEDGSPRARVLALRSVDREARRLVFHTDARSDKVREIDGEQRVAVLFFDREDAVQARFDGTCVVHHADPVAAAAWRGVS